MSADDPARAHRRGARLAAAYSDARVLTLSAVAHAYARRAATSARPIVVGPWYSEVGFELLYWIPFLRALFRRHDVEPSRVTAISRGGVASWYSGIADTYLDLLEVIPPKRVADEHDRKAMAGFGQKQTRVTAFDRELFSLLRSRLPPRPAVVHPAAMYNRYRPVWIRRRSPELVRRSSLYRPIECQDDALERPRTDGYIALKPYFNDAIPASAANRAQLAEIMRVVAGGHDVLVLGDGAQVDEHEQLSLPDLPSMPATRPELNLAAQTRAVAGARALVATYGGFAYLAPFLGVPVIALHADSDLNTVHLEVLRHARRALAGTIARPEASPFVLADLGSLDLLDLVVAGTHHSSQSSLSA